MLLGYDIGSSSVKASVVDALTGECLATTFFPKQEMAISSPQPGFAEQNPTDWWNAAIECTHELIRLLEASGKQPDIKAIGISYQMHGLVCMGRDEALRPSIIWCDSRAVSYGNNFTAGKLAWVHDHEPDMYNQIEKILLPGDYIAYKLTGDMRTTVSGLSEGLFWDMQHNSLNEAEISRLHLNPTLLADTVPTFGLQGTLTEEAARQLRLTAGIPITYRAGDQPNNALSLGVLDDGEVAATGGTSGVVYAVSDKPVSDPLNRVNPFVHVNGKTGILLCINSVGILNAWLRRNVASDLSYAQMNDLAATAPIGSEGLTLIPFGNGAERVLQNRPSHCSVCYHPSYSRRIRQPVPVSHLPADTLNSDRCQNTIVQYRRKYRCRTRSGYRCWHLLHPKGCVPNTSEGSRSDAAPLRKNRNTSRIRPLAFIFDNKHKI